MGPCRPRGPGYREGAPLADCGAPAGGPLCVAGRGGALGPPGSLLVGVGHILGGEEILAYTSAFLDEQVIAIRMGI